MFMAFVVFVVLLSRCKADRDGNDRRIRRGRYLTLGLQLCCTNEASTEAARSQAKCQNSHRKLIDSSWAGWIGCDRRWLIHFVLWAKDDWIDSLHLEFKNLKSFDESQRVSYFCRNTAEVGLQGAWQHRGEEWVTCFEPESHGNYTKNAGKLARQHKMNTRSLRWTNVYQSKNGQKPKASKEHTLQGTNG